MHSQGRLDQSMSFHSRALTQFGAPVGFAHRRTADACYHLAEHYMRLQHLEEAESVNLDAMTWVLCADIQITEIFWTRL